ncbi:MAG: FAD-dependent oxidoreductase [Pararhizobium sp.]
MARIGIVGGGIIGCATAIHLIARGHDVTLFEQDASGLPASVGNAGIMAIPEIDPIARPDMLLSAPRWLADPLGPLTLRWTDLPALTPWLLAFLRSARPAQAARTRTALLGLMRTVLDDHRHLAEMASLVDPVQHTGAMTIFDAQTALDAAFRHESETARLLGFAVERLSPAEVRARIPALEGALAGGIFSAGYHTFRHPETFLRALQAHVRARATLVDAGIAAVRPSADGITLTTSAGVGHSFDKAVIAAGVWSRDLVRGLGLRVSLETERGYNTTFTDPHLTLPMPIFFSEHGFCATPFDNALRVGGAVELARPDAPANFARAKAMRTKMRRYVPALPETGGKEWMGRRPSTPDSLPVIGLSPDDPRIALAFGHGHLGLTLSATTGRLVAELFDTGEQPALAPFSIRRFQRGTKT